MPRRVSLLLAGLIFAYFPSAAFSAQSDPLDPANPALERIWIGGRLIAVDRLPAQVPAAFSFTDQSDVSASTLIYSNIVQITGLGFPSAVDLSGTGSPEYRICSTSNCSSVVQTWTATSVEIDNNAYLQLRLTSGAVSESRSATPSIGGVDDEWVVNTEGADTTPNAFNYTDQTNVALATLTNSNILQISGINVAVTVTISGTAGPQYRTCSTSNCSSVIQTWTASSGSISNNQYLQLRTTSPATANTLRTATVSVGTGSDVWNVTTRPSGNITLTTTGTWTVPAGVTQVSVTATGGGGGGAGGGSLAETDSGELDSGYDAMCGPWVQGYVEYTGGGGGGGGGGGSVSGPTNLSVTPAAQIGYTIGAGGAGGSVGAGGSTGGTTTFQTVSGSGGTGGSAGLDGSSGGYGGGGGTTGGATANDGEVCMDWAIVSYFCGVLDEGTTCTSYSTGNASGGGSGNGGGGAGGLGEEYTVGRTGGSTGTAGKIIITWP
jgi:hypothetical protein